MFSKKQITIILICTKRPTELFFKSLESLRIQTKSDFNMLFINNGNCPEVKAILDMPEFSHLHIDYYTEEKFFYPGYLRIKYAKKVKTPYCAFLDENDKFYPETIEYLNVIIQKYQDKPVALFQFGVFYNPTNYIICSPEDFYIDKDRLSFLERPFPNEHYRITTHNWNKLYKTEVFINLDENNYDNTLFLEDACITLDILKQCEKKKQDIVLLNKILYTSFQNTNSQICTGDSFKAKKKKLDGILTFVKKCKQEKLYNPIQMVFNIQIVKYLLQAYHLSLFNKVKTYFYLLFKIFPFYNIFNKHVPKFKRKFIKESILLFTKNFYDNILFRIFSKIASLYCNIILFLISPFIREKKNYWLYHTHFFNDMNLIMFVDYVLKEEKSNIKHIIVYRYNWEKKNIIKSAEVLYVSMFNPKLPFIVAKTHKLFSVNASKSHPFQYIGKRKFFVQLWHGIPIKTIGYLAHGPLETFKYQYAYYNFLISSSQSDRLAMSLAFSPDKPEKVHITGLPRNDLILQLDDQKIPEPYRSHTQVVKEGIKNKKVILYAPTWRDPKVFSTNKEGFQHYNPNLNELVQLKKLLEKHNACIVFKPHSMTQMFKQEIFPIYDNEFFIDYKWVDVNVLIRLADIMISDYSSTSLDFMLTQKPIIHFNYDMEIYNAQRGFIYNKESIFPGEQTQTFKGLLELLDKQLTSPSISENYKYLRTFFHQYTDINNSQRIMEVLKIV